MQIITTHNKMDFDTLTSVVACTFLYPGDEGILPSHIAPEVNAFLSIHQDLFRAQPRKAFDHDSVNSQIVVDANNWKQLNRMESLSQRREVEIICWDHHMDGDTIQP